MRSGCSGLADVHRKDPSAVRRRPGEVAAPRHGRGQSRLFVGPPGTGRGLVRFPTLSRLGARAPVGSHPKTGRFLEKIPQICFRAAGFACRVVRRVSCAGVGALSAARWRFSGSWDSARSAGLAQLAGLVGTQADAGRPQLPPQTPGEASLAFRRRDERAGARVEGLGQGFSAQAAGILVAKLPPRLSC